MPIITLPDHNLSNSALRRSKAWMKILTGVDTSQGDGYAFLGTFAKHEDTIEVDNGTWILEYVEDVRASGRVDGRDVTIHQVRDGALDWVEHWYLDGNRGWALKIRDQIAAMITEPAPVDAPTGEIEVGYHRRLAMERVLAARITEPAPVDPAALTAERELLFARIDEINALLQTATDPTTVKG